MPTLTGSDDIGRGARQTGGFCGRLPKAYFARADRVFARSDRDGLLEGELAGGLEHSRIGIDSDARTGALRELSREGAGAGAEIDDDLTGLPDFIWSQAIEQGGWKAVSVFCVVRGGETEAPG